MLADVVQDADIRVRQGRRRTRLALEPRSLSRLGLVAYSATL